MPKYLVAFAAGLMAVCLCQSAWARVTQSVEVGYDDGSGFTVNQFDFIEDPVDPLTDSILAQYSGEFANATGAVGAFGDLGVEARQFATGMVSTSVLISNDFVPNLSGQGRQAQLRFIIDGGMLQLIAGLGSTLDFNLSLLGFIFDANDDFVDFVNYSTSIGIEADDAFGGYNPTFSGSDIGAQDIGAGRVEIPLSFQTVDLGVIPGGGYVDFSYSLNIVSNVVGFAEVVGWEFSDPLSVDDSGIGPQVVFLNQTTSVPEPASLALFAIGLSGIWKLRRRRLNAVRAR